MKVSELLGERYKDRVAEIESQNLMVRGGYIKQVGNGIYSLMPPARRIHNKIEAILRQEMDRIDGQEVLFPVTMPATLWQASGRWESVGKELLRFKDRSGADMVLGMTHEEAAVHMAMNVASTYQKYPFMIYQIQTKFRDEPRARGGLIRVREFTMKDAYSFHTSQADLEKYYERAYVAYERIFRRVGAKNVIAVKSDSGMMGGKISHEFMLLTDIGEDTLVLCSDEGCGYRANMEVAECLTEPYCTTPSELKKVHTPGFKTIDEVCGFLGKDKRQACKAVVYRENLTDKYVIAFVRGDLEVNETKLRNVLKKEIHPATEIDAESGIVAGFIGAYGLKADATVVFDRSLEKERDLIAGANEPDYHYVGLDISRDIGKVEYCDIAKAAEGGICPKCGKKTLRISRGIEVGNIFQLGDKYTKSMGMTYVDADGALKTPIMGCYGIGVGRLAASICEAHHDDYGPIWPMSIAPWHVQLCSLRADNEEVAAESKKLAETLEARGIEVIWDDRPVSAGFMFSDADLFGVPVRVVVSPKGLKNGTIEISSRDKKLAEKLPLEEAIAFISKLTLDAIAAAG